MRYQVTAHVEDRSNSTLSLAVRFELDAPTLARANYDALQRMHQDYPGKTFSFRATPVSELPTELPATE